MSLFGPCARCLWPPGCTASQDAPALRQAIMTAEDLRPRNREGWPDPGGPHLPTRSPSAGGAALGRQERSDLDRDIALLRADARRAAEAANAQQAATHGGAGGTSAARGPAWPRIDPAAEVIYRSRGRLPIEDGRLIGRPYRPTRRRPGRTERLRSRVAAAADAPAPTLEGVAHGLARSTAAPRRGCRQAWSRERLVELTLDPAAAGPPAGDGGLWRAADRQRRAARCPARSGVAGPAPGGRGGRGQAELPGRERILARALADSPGVA
jgi:hypothetical protein